MLPLDTQPPYPAYRGDEPWDNTIADVPPSRLNLVLSAVAVVGLIVAAAWMN